MPLEASNTSQPREIDVFYKIDFMAVGICVWCNYRPMEVFYLSKRLSHLSPASKNHWHIVVFWTVCRSGRTKTNSRLGNYTLLWESLFFFSFFENAFFNWFLRANTYGVRRRSIDDALHSQESIVCAQHILCIHRLCTRDIQEKKSTLMTRFLTRNFILFPNPAKQKYWFP